MLFVLTLSTYVVFFAIPTNPVCQAVEIIDCSARPTDAEMSAAEHQLGLDRPVVEQYASFLSNLVTHRTFGYTFNGISINRILEYAVPVTASVFLGGALTLLLLALPLGFAAATRAGGHLDRAVLVVCASAFAVHPFVLGLMLRSLFAHKLHAAPDAKYCPISPGGGDGCSHFLVSWAFHLYLPWLMFALLFLPIYVRMIRTLAIQTLTQPFVRVARAKGASERRVLYGHVLRNATVPLLPMLAADVGSSLTAAIYIETIFNLGGLGAFALHALGGGEHANGYDLPSIAAVVFVIGVIVAVATALADIGVALMDPRVKRRP